MSDIGVQVSLANERLRVNPIYSMIGQYTCKGMNENLIVAFRVCEATEYRQIIRLCNEANPRLEGGA